MSPPKKGGLAVSSNVLENFTMSKKNISLLLLLPLTFFMSLTLHASAQNTTVVTKILTGNCSRNGMFGGGNWNWDTCTFPRNGAFYSGKFRLKITKIEGGSSTKVRITRTGDKEYNLNANQFLNVTSDKKEVSQVRLFPQERGSTVFFEIQPY
jgi:hypothetical protein